MASGHSYAYMWANWAGKGAAALQNCPLHRGDKEPLATVLSLTDEQSVLTLSNSRGLGYAEAIWQKWDPSKLLANTLNILFYVFKGTMDSVHKVEMQSTPQLRNP